MKIIKEQFFFFSLLSILPDRLDDDTHESFTIKGRGCETLYNLRGGSGIYDGG